MTQAGSDRARRAWIIGALVLMAGLTLALLPLGGALSADQRIAAGLILIAIGFWAGQVLPDATVALGFIVAVLLLGIVGPTQAFTGFLAGANWLVFAGIVVGLSVRHVGLTTRLADLVLAFAPRRYIWTVVATGLFAFALTFVIPSSVGRIVILVPVAVALAEALGYREGDPGRTGIVLTAGAATYFPCFGVLPAGLPNVIIYGAAESLYGLRFTYGDWLLLNGPVVGLVKTGILIASALILFRPAMTGNPAAPDRAVQSPAGDPAATTTAQRRTMLVLGATIALWALDSVHGISPAWIGLAAAFVLILPGLGLTPREPFKALDLAPFFYVAGVLAIGAVVAETGLGALTAEALIGAMALDGASPAEGLLKLMGLSFLLGLFFTIAASPAVFAPLAGDLAQATGLPLDLVLTSQLVGMSSMILPYQGPPLVVAAMLGGVGAGATLRFCLLQGVLSILLLPGLQIGWWDLLGRF